MKVMRLCARSADLVGTGVNLVTEIRQCAFCECNVSYDPAASVPELGEEVIVCMRCADVLAELIG